MSTFVCLLRGINVGGHTKIRMDALRRLAEGLGYSRVESYLQSGNLVIDSADPSAAGVAAGLSQGIAEHFNLRVNAVVLRATDLEPVIGGNPFVARAGVDPSKLAVVFLAGVPSEQAVAELSSMVFGEDEFVVGEQHVYLYCPNGNARSKLSNAMFEKRFGLVATARNWRTVNALSNLVKQRVDCS